MSPMFQDEVAALLDSKNISYVKKPKRISVMVDKQMIEKNREVVRSVAEFVKKSW